MASPKSTLGCLCKESRQRRKGEGKWSSSVAKDHSEEISQPVSLTTERRGIRSDGCSHFLIPSEHILHLTSKPLMATEKSPHFQQRGSGVGGSGGSVTQAQRPHCDCERWCVRQCCLTGSSNDLRRLSRKTQDLPAVWGNTHWEGRNRRATA